MAEPSSKFIIGMRFVPRDDELLYLLLNKHRNGYTIPHEFNLIIDESVYKTEPWNLKRNTLYKLENEMYYFTMAKRKSRGKKNSILERSAGNGYWHMNGQNIPIKIINEVVGHKTALKYYYYDKNKKGVQTKWIMNEYRLKYLADDFDLNEELVLCRIQKTKTGREVGEEIISSNENQSSLVAHHQAALPQVPVSSVPVPVPVPYDASERPGSKRLRRDNTCNGTQYYNTGTGSTSMAPAPEAAATPFGCQEDQYYYNTNTSVPDQQYYQQQYWNTISSVPVPDHHQYFNSTTDASHQQQQQEHQHGLSSSVNAEEEEYDDEHNEFLRTINQFKKFT